MNNVCIPILLSTLAGLSTTVGACLILFTQKENKKMLAFALAFAAGVMVSISVLELIPEGYHGLIKNFTLMQTILIMVLTMLIGYGMTVFVEKKVVVVDSKLYKIGLISMIVLILHNIPEGIVTFMAGFTSISLGIKIAVAIALHNIPEGISIAFPIYYATGSKAKGIMYAFLSGLSEPLGAIATFLLLRPLINTTNLAIMFLLIAGIMLTIALRNLIPEAKRYNYPKLLFVSVSLGILVVMLSEFFL